MARIAKDEQGMDHTITLEPNSGSSVDLRELTQEDITALAETLVEVEHGFAIIVDQCLDQVPDMYTAAQNLRMLHGWLDQFERQCLTVQLKTLKRIGVKEMIPPDVWTFPWDQFRQEIELPTQNDTRLFNTIRREFRRRERIEYGWGLELPLGLVLGLSAVEILCFPNCGIQTLVTFHKRLHERGWLGYCRSRDISELSMTEQSQYKERATFMKEN